MSKKKSSTHTEATPPMDAETKGELPMGDFEGIFIEESVEIIEIHEVPTEEDHPELLGEDDFENDLFSGLRKKKQLSEEEAEDEEDFNSYFFEE